MNPTDDSQESFLTVLQQQDALGAVIRAHFHIDACLQRVLESRVHSPEELPRLKYAQKARMVVALGVDGRMLPVMQMLGRLHENAGRYVDAGVTDTAVNQLFGVLAKEDREAVLQLVREQAGEGAYHDFAPLQRFTAIVAVIESFLAAAFAPANVLASTLASTIVSTPGSPAAPDQEEPVPGAESSAEVVTFEWSAPAPPRRRASDFASREALYSWLTASDW